MAMRGRDMVLKEPCAACKHQRRKCLPNCTFAPYFPSECVEQFQAVQSLYGVANFIKRFNKVPQDARDLFVETMTSEACMRRDHPVLGCFALINDLRHDLQEANVVILQQQQHIAQLLQQQQQQQQQVAFVPHFGGQIKQPQQQPGNGGSRFGDGAGPSNFRNQG